jgi:hypothetical protein
MSLLSYPRGIHQALNDDIWMMSGPVQVIVIAFRMIPDIWLGFSFRSPTTGVQTAIAPWDKWKLSQAALLASEFFFVS